MEISAHGQDRTSPPVDVQIRLLGSFQVCVGKGIKQGRTWRLRKAATLIQILALTPGHQLHRDQLIDLLWPDALLEHADNNFHQVLYVARHSLDGLDQGVRGSQILRLNRHIVSVGAPGQLWTDVEAFEQAARYATQTEAIPDYRAAIGKYSGDLLEEEPYDDRFVNHREALRRKFHRLLRSLAKRYEEQGDIGHAIDILQQLIQSEPADEGAHTGLIRLYASAGLQHQAIVQYQTLQQTALEEIGAPPNSAADALYESIIAGTFDASPAHQLHTATGSHRYSEETVPGAESPPTNLPTNLTGIIARDREVNDIKALLGITRLLTLSGPGGIGKTRLALAICQDLVSEFAGKVYLVPLAPIREPPLILSQVAQVLDIREIPDVPIDESIRQSIGEQHILLLLDNFEHLAVGGPDIANLVAACPHLHVLITSRARLRMSGEHEYPVPPLPVPDTEHLPDGETVMSYGAVALFLQRSREVQPEFTVRPDTAPVIAEIAHRLDGLPLAIELAAARSKVLSPSSMLRRLDHPLDLLNYGQRDHPMRLQTIRNTIAWSYDLLSNEQQRVFRQMGVFIDGWTLEAAEAVAGQDGPGTFNVLDGLTVLVDHSLVQQQVSHDRERLSMLETVREYARERLIHEDEYAPARSRHAEYFATLSNEIAPALMGPEQEHWLALAQQELGNFRFALRWCTGSTATVETGLRIAGNLWMFWDIRGYLSEGRRWLEQLISMATQRTPAHAQACFAAGYLATRQGNPAAAKPQLDAGLSMYRELGDRPGVARTLGMLGAITSFEGDFARSSRLLEEALSVFREIGDELGTARTLLDLGDQIRVEGDYPRARVLLEESQYLLRKLGFERASGWSLANLGNIARAEDNDVLAMSLFNESKGIFTALADKRGLSRPVLYLANLARRRRDFESASALMLESLKLLQDIDDKWRLPVWLYYAGLMAIDRADFELGTQLLAAAETSHDRFQTLLDPAERDDGARALTTAKRHLPEGVFHRAHLAGAQLPMERAIDRACATFEAF